MKTVRLEVYLQIPETLEECDSLCDDKGKCYRCAYFLEDPLPPCKHRKVLEAIGGKLCWNDLYGNGPNWNDVKKKSE